MSANSEVDATHFKDNNNAVYSVDHVTMATSNDVAGGADGAGRWELHRAALQSALDAYLSSNYTCELAAGTATEKNGVIHVSICTEKPNLRNFWAGKWSSSWAITMGADSASVTGEVKVSSCVRCVLNVWLFTLRSL